MAWWGTISYKTVAVHGSPSQSLAVAAIPLRYPQDAVVFWAWTFSLCSIGISTSKVRRRHRQLSMAFYIYLRWNLHLSIHLSTSSAFSQCVVLTLQCLIHHAAGSYCHCSKGAQGLHFCADGWFCLPMFLDFVSTFSQKSIMFAAITGDRWNRHPCRLMSPAWFQSHYWRLAPCFDHVESHTCHTYCRSAMSQQYIWFLQLLRCV